MAPLETIELLHRKKLTNPMIWKMLGFSHQFLVAWENATNRENLGNWYPYFPQSMGTFFPSDSHPTVSPIPWKIHGFSHQFLIASIPDTLELKAKYIRRKRRGNGCYFIKKEEYKYTLGKIIPPYTKLSLLLTISSKNYNSYPKISTKSAATVAFGRKVSEGYSFKKDSQFNSYFSIAMWCYGCSASQTFVFHSLYCYTEFVDIVIAFCFSLSFFRKCVNLGYIHWTKAQTFSLPILDYLLVYAY